jgi:acetoin utilization deacetylase AcuC-like enzyme
VFRIRRVHDAELPANKKAIAEVQQILADRFASVRREEIDELPEILRNPFLQRFSAVLYVAENERRRVLGLALVLQEPVLRFSFLDFLAAGKELGGRGIGGALYERVRDDALESGSRGLFFECLPDEPDRCRDPELRKQNAARLRFYERYGARPIVGTAYETPVPGGGSDNLPHLVFDDLGTGRPPAAALIRDAIRAVLERKYYYLCPPEYVHAVVGSVVDDPVRLRPPRYSKATTVPAVTRIRARNAREKIALVVNDRHQIHHIKERGYVEAPVRIRVIRDALEAAGIVEPVAVDEFPLRHITDVHDRRFVSYLRRVSASLPDGRSVYPYVFPIRNLTRLPRDLSIRAGYYCIDTFTPIHRNSFLAAKRGVDCTLTAAEQILGGRRLAYSLVRPPGHHAESRVFGGFCYFNNAAVAAQYLVKHGRVAILDIDYHHGNGQQEIFYGRSDVLTISIHADPEIAYPYFTGFGSERGSGSGLGYNRNFALPELVQGSEYLAALRSALDLIRRFQPVVLIVALGLDPARGDPTGTWTLKSTDFQANGRAIGELRLPTLVVQEGGYRTRSLGGNARGFFQGLLEGSGT